MPTYEYWCKNCDNIIETRHGMSEAPTVECPECKSTHNEKIISAVNMNTSTGATHAAKKLIDKTKRQTDMATDLRENVGVHNMAVNQMQCRNYEHAYKEIKANAQAVRDTMKEKAKQTEKENREKQIERHKSFAKIKDQRIKELKERQAKTAFEKRKIGGNIKSKPE